LACAWTGSSPRTSPRRFHVRASKCWCRSARNARRGSGERRSGPRSMVAQGAPCGRARRRGGPGAGARLTLRVTYWSAPVAHAEMWLAAGGLRHGTTDERGEVTFDVPAGRVSLLLVSYKLQSLAQGGCAIPGHPVTVPDAASPRQVRYYPCARTTATEVPGQQCYLFTWTDSPRVKKRRFMTRGPASAVIRSSLAIES